LTYLWFVKVVFLTWLGAQPVEYPYVMLSQVCSVIYFSYFLCYVC
jgi:ubiquinol-cytochrome c reductase cytochrome b subunit